MFVGTYSPRLDDKGRLFLPAKYRDRFASGVFVTRGQENALLLFPRDEFDRMTERLRDVPLTSEAGRKFVRLFLSAAAEVIPDRQGRITVPLDLRAYATLTKECTVVGVGNRMEIWDAAAWDAWLNANEPAFSSISEEVLGQNL